MTKEAVEGFETALYNRMSSERNMELAKLNEYYRGYNDGLMALSKAVCAQLEQEELKKDEIH